jgi:hypothetical protein
MAARTKRIEMRADVESEALIAAAARIPIMRHLPKGRPAPGKAIR